MRLKILGAAREVTGSSYLIEVGDSRVLVDCGLHQGENEEANYDPLPYDPTSLSAMILTHAHIDHSGRIPLLARGGFKGKVFCTLPTAELVEVLWNDSAHLMEEDARWRSRKNQRRGLPPVQPLFDMDDVEGARKLLYPISYDDKISIAPGIEARFRDGGHIIGSSIVETFLSDGNEKVKVVFSGDLGPMKTVMEREPAEIDSADYVLIESTYGNRNHKTNEETRVEFQNLMKKLLNDKGKVFIPTFVVDRAQRVMYELSLLRDQGIGTDIPVFFDSPMGVKVTEIYQNHMDLMSQEIQQYRREGHDPFKDNITFVSTPDESRALNEVPHGIFMAGSGMVTGGRMTHHLKNNIWDPKNHVIFVGYQAKGTLGRRIVDGAKTARINGEEVAIKAQIHTLGGFSAHADKTDLLTWAENFRTTMPQFVVVHGEEESSVALAESLQERGFKALVPEVGMEITLTPNRLGQLNKEASEARSNAGELVRDNVEDVVVDELYTGGKKEKQSGKDKVLSKQHKKQERANSKRYQDLLQQVGDQLNSLSTKPMSGDRITLLRAVSLMLENTLKDDEEHVA